MREIIYMSRKKIANEKSMVEKRKILHAQTLFAKNPYTKRFFGKGSSVFPETASSIKHTAIPYFTARAVIGYTIISDADKNLIENIISAIFEPIKKLTALIQKKHNGTQHNMHKSCRCCSFFRPNTKLSKISQNRITKIAPVILKTIFLSPVITNAPRKRAAK